MKRVLIVDDDFEDLKLMSSILEKNEYKICAATNGAKALDLIKGNEFDLIIIDVKMPTLSGYDLLRLLKERISQKMRAIYVSVVPGKDVDKDGIDGFIQKPFSETSFMKEVNKVLRN